MTPFLRLIFVSPFSLVDLLLTPSGMDSGWWPSRGKSNLRPTNSPYGWSNEEAVVTAIEIEGDRLVINVEGADKLWALRSRLEIPLAHVKATRIDLAFVSHERYQGLKIAGARVPGVITAGSFRQEGDTVFWDVHHPEKAIIIELADERYARLVVEVENPSATVGLITRALGRS